MPFIKKKFALNIDLLICFETSSGSFNVPLFSPALGKHILSMLKVNVSNVKSNVKINERLSSSTVLRSQNTDSVTDGFQRLPIARRVLFLKRME